MTHDINDQMQRLRRYFERADEAANVMAQPVAWAQVNDYNPAATWADGREETIRLLRGLAALANEIADHAATLPAWEQPRAQRECSDNCPCRAP